MDRTHERRALAVVLATLFIDVIGFGIVMPVMPDLIVGLTHVTIGEAARIGGLLLSSFAGMQFLCGPVMGALGDRFGRRPVLLACLVAFGIDYIVMGLAPTIGWLFASRALAGVAGASFVPATAYVADITPPERRAQNFGLIGAVFGLGFVVGPSLGGRLGPLGVRVPFFFAGGLALTNALVGLFLLPESLPLERRRRFSFSRANPFGTFAALGKHQGTAPLFVAWFLWMLAHQSYPSTWAFYTKLKFGWSEAAIGLSLAYSGLLMALGQAFVSRRLIPAIGERRSILLGLSLGFVGFTGNALAPHGWVVFIVLAVAALQGLVFPSMNATLTRLVSSDQQGELQGGVASLQSLSAVLAPPLLTGSFEHFTRAGAKPFLPGAPYLLAATFTALSALTVAVFARGVFRRSTAAMAAARAASGAAPAGH